MAPESSWGGGDGSSRFSEELPLTGRGGRRDLRQHAFAPKVPENLAGTWADLPGDGTNTGYRQWGSQWTLADHRRGG